MKIIPLMLLPKFRPRRKKKILDKEQIGDIVQQNLQQELGSYIKREELKGYIAEIEKDERKKKIWNNLSARKKLKLLKYLAGKKAKDGKK